MRSLWLSALRPEALGSLFAADFVEKATVLVVERCGLKQIRPVGESFAELLFSAPAADL
jgi:hypothetical protein